MFRKLLVLSVLASGLAFAAGPVYELRTYTAAEGKLNDLIARFRDHTVKIFNKHHIESIGYWVPQDKKNTLIYIVKHASREEGEKNWTAFQADPEWQKVRTESEAKGPLQLNIERVWMEALDFSKLK